MKYVIEHFMMLNGFMIFIDDINKILKHPYKYTIICVKNETYEDGKGIAE